MANLETNHQDQAERRLLRLPEVIRKTGYKKASLYNKIRQGEFPKGIQIGPRAVAWDSQEVESWIESKINQ